MERNRIYFTADAHLGSPLLHDGAAIERSLVAWLEAISPTAKAVYFLGDIFDFWYEYRYVVPKGFVRLLGAIARLTDSGVEVHFLVGNHDIWCRDYFEKELGVVLHRHAFEIEIDGKRFRLAHGDEEYRSHSKMENFLYTLFRNPFARALFSAVHPRWSMPLGLHSSKESRKKELEKHKSRPQLPMAEEWLAKWTCKYAPLRPELDFFLFGHRHLLADVSLESGQRMVLLGDWIHFSSYAVWDGQAFSINLQVSESLPLGKPADSSFCFTL